MKALLAGLAALALTSAVHAQAVDDVEATVVEEFVVKARLPGPAWWKVSDGDSVVWVLGVPDALPKGLKWNQSVLNRRLQGANVVITPPELRAGASPLAVPGLIVSARRTVRLENGFSAAVPDPLERRFEAAARSAGFKPESAEDLRPWFAGLRLVETHRKRARLDGSQPEAAIRTAVRRAKVKTRPAFVVDMKAKALIAELRGVTPALELDCLGGAVEEVEGGAEPALTAGRAWATGDVSRALTAPRSTERCLALVPSAGPVKREALGRQADAIAEALKTPGHSVAVLSLRSLLAKDGVLDRLRARGLTVRNPE